MTEADNSFINEMLREIRADIREMKQDVRDIRIRQTVVEGHLTGLMVSVQLVSEQMDRLRDDMRLVKRRLDLVDAV